MKNTLLVYYSYTGHTRKLARQIARMINCDLEEIYERQPRQTGIRAFFQAAYDSYTKKYTPIEELYHQPDQYEHIIIGTPVWAGHMASPIRSFLQNHRLEIKSVSFFCTYGGNGGIQTLDEMAQLLGKPVQSSFAFTGETIQNPAYLEKRIQDFVASWSSGLSITKETPPTSIEITAH